MDSAKRRLQIVHSALQAHSPQWKPLLVLPDDCKITVASLPDGTTKIAIDDANVLDYRPLSHSAALVLSAIGTTYETDNPTPKYTVLELFSPDGRPTSIPDLWASIYTLWTLLHIQEHIPITLSSSIPNSSELIEYILFSGLGRKRLSAHTSDEPSSEIFLARATFWQGAGAGVQWNNTRAWLPGDYAARTATFPATQSFTRTPLVITAHPLRPPKPPAGACVYKRFCTPVSKTFSLHTMDVEDAGHMEAFHRWHNDGRVSEWWGEHGTIDQHRAYVRRMAAEPGVLSLMMSWDGELMGYCELVWIKVSG